MNHPSLTKTHPRCDPLRWQSRLHSVRKSHVEVNQYRYHMGKCLLVHHTGCCCLCSCVYYTLWGGHYGINFLILAQYFNVELRL